MKRRNKSNNNPNPKSNPFLIKGGEGWSLVARWTVFPVLGSSVCVEGIDNAAVVIDRMTGCAGKLAGDTSIATEDKCPGALNRRLRELRQSLGNCFRIGV
jgi:hypothetical protein